MSALAALAEAVSEFADHIGGLSQLQLRADLANQRRERANNGLPEPEWWGQFEDLARAVRLSVLHDRPCAVCGYRPVAINVNRRLFDGAVDLPAPTDEDLDPHFVGLCGLCFKAFRAKRRPSCALS